MEDKIRKALEASTNYQTGEIDGELAIDKLLILFSVTKRFSDIELRNILSKTHLVTIKENFFDIMGKHTGYEEYKDKDSIEFFKKYAGKKVNVYSWCGDWWICEDDNYPLTKNCFVENVW